MGFPIEQTTDVEELAPEMLMEASPFVSFEKALHCQSLKPLNLFQSPAPFLLHYVSEAIENEL